MANEVAISLPFTIDPYGKVGSTQSQQKIWQDRVLSVIGTTLRERVMRPDFGTIIPYALFDGVETATSEVEAEVRTAFSRQLRHLNLDKVEAVVDEVTNVLKVTITYDLPNNQKVTTNIGLISIAGTLPSYEELS